MSFEEIGKMNLRQVNILLKEYEKQKVRRIEALNDFMKESGKNVFPVADLTRGIS